MKTLTTILLVCTMLCGCRLYTVTQGDGYIYSESGNFLCVRNAGDCIEQYDTPTSETLSAQPAQDHAFRRWEGCNYKALTSCETDISQTAIDDDLEWTITAVFEKKRPDVQPAQYTYNALGQRITKTVGGVTTVFQYDLDGNLIAELDAGGHPLRQHVYLEGAPIAMLERKTPQSNTAVYYVHTDHLATPDLITNDNGRIVADFENTPFGVPYINYSEIDYYIGFPGQYYDDETGLHYNYHRNYDAHTGRYMQSDPIGLRGGLNTYSYARQNPTHYIDPTGEGPYGLMLAAVCELVNGLDTAISMKSGSKKLEQANQLRDNIRKLDEASASCPSERIGSEAHRDLIKFRDKLIADKAILAANSVSSDQSAIVGGYRALLCSAFLRLPI